MRHLIFIQDEEPKTDFLTDRDYAFWYITTEQSYKAHQWINGVWKFKYWGIIENFQQNEINPLKGMGYKIVSNKDIREVCRYYFIKIFKPEIRGIREGDIWITKIFYPGLQEDAFIEYEFVNNGWWCIDAMMKKEDLKKLIKELMDGDSEHEYNIDSIFLEYLKGE